MECRSYEHKRAVKDSKNRDCVVLQYLKNKKNKIFNLSTEIRDLFPECLLTDFLIIHNI